METVCQPVDRSQHEPEYFAHSPLTRYCPSERRAILVHRYFLSVDLQREASLDETTRSWESGPGMLWRREKMRRDRQQQIKEIEKHKYFLSMRCGYDIGWEAAANDWIANHAAAWRDWWEQQKESGA